MFVIGTTGNIESGFVRRLIEKRVETIVYVRDEQKTKDLFKNELNRKHLTIVVSN